MEIQKMMNLIESVNENKIEATNDYAIMNTVRGKVNKQPHNVEMPVSEKNKELSEKEIKNEKKDGITPLT